MTRQEFYKRTLASRDIIWWYSNTIDSFWKVDVIKGPMLRYALIIFIPYFTEGPLSCRFYSILLGLGRLTENIIMLLSFIMNRSVMWRASSNALDRGFEACATLACLSIIHHIVVWTIVPLAQSC